MQRRKYLVLLYTGLLFSSALLAQTPRRYTSADLLDGIQKLQFLGSALYVAAHPDDENTRLIAYLANVRDANTAYLSLTRGDGGQNLIGPEISELLGLIRTQELLAARRIDGGQQFFSRANDFGFSKHSDETLQIWNKDEVLSDVVWIMRKFQPDVIINRFDHRTPGETHGHHTSSAILSTEAFDLAGNPQAYPEQLEHVDAWQPKRLFFNTFWWFYGSPEAFEAAIDTMDVISVEVGQYLPLRGESTAEIAARSRSQHKSQGFGSSGARGLDKEYLELIKGDAIKRGDDLFAGINTTWSRVKGGAPIGELLKKVESAFDFNHPAKSVPGLLQVRSRIAALPDSYWKRVKLAEIEELIVGASGLFLEVTANDPNAAPSRPLTLTYEAINRSAAQVRLLATRIEPLGKDSTLRNDLPTEKGISWKQNLVLPADLPFSNAYWLDRPATLGMYNVPDQDERGRPETPAPVQVAFQLEFYQPLTKKWVPLEVVRPVVYKETDPVKGEVYQPFVVTPPVFVDIEQSAFIFADDEPRAVEVKVTAGRDSVSGTVELRHDARWQVQPNNLSFSLVKKGQEQTLRFELYPPAEQGESTITPLAIVDGGTYDRSLVTIDYDHIPKQSVFLDATTKVARLNLQMAGRRIGYVMGAGDDIPAALREIGYQVDLLSLADLQVSRLKGYDAVVMGVRAYNTIDRIGFYQPALLQYVEQGGTLIVQYNTNRGLNLPMDQLGPYPLRLSRERVTVEDAEVRFLAPEHPVLTFPNRITEADFAGWVQERGLYFADQWDDRYTAVLSSNDPGEPARDGGLLIAPHGKGFYVYTGFSWFRELPAGVPGAYRLFANLLSLSQAPKSRATEGDKGGR